MAKKRAQTRRSPPKRSAKKSAAVGGAQSRKVAKKRPPPRTRDADAARKLAERAAARDVEIPAPSDVDLRARCLADPYVFVETCFPRVFFQPFTCGRRAMGDAIIHAARHGGDQAIAGPRGDGKTRLALFLALHLELCGQVTFPLIVSKSGRRAARELKNLKDAIRDSDEFAALFPEVALPIRALGGWASRARQQTVGGVFTHLEWSADAIVLPTVATATLQSLGWPAGTDSTARGQITASLGVEGAIRGYSIRNERPDLAIIDDIDDRESANSETLTDDRCHIIEEDIGGLAGPDRTIARVMLCTLLNHTCIAAMYTDRSKKPSWKGQRHKLLEVLPTREDLWLEYVALRQNRAETDPDARAAHQFYAARQSDMDAGAIVSNPYRFDARPMADGSPAQLSALQACYDLIADRGQVTFDTEYQNDPPVAAGPIESGITPHRVQRQLNGLDRLALPQGAVLVTCGIDVRKTALHWTAVAWQEDASGHVIAYGVHETVGAIYGSDQGLDLILRRACLGLLEELRATLPRVPDLTLIDAGWRTDAVYAACAEAGLGVLPVKGFGKSSGCTAANFYDIQRRSQDKRPGDGWFLSRQGSLWLVCADTDRWKSWLHDRWMTAPDNPGCMYLYGTPGQPGGRLSADEKAHHSFAHHLTNEVEVEELTKGKLVRRRKAKSENTHWLDAAYYACVAANIKGVRLPMKQTAKATAPERIPGQQTTPRPAPVSLAAMAAAARARGG